MKSEVAVITAFDTSEERLSVFFKNGFPGHDEFLAKNWKWLNRTSFKNNKTPLVLSSDNELIGAAGRIPVNLSIADKEYSGAWYIDIAVLSGFQGKGLGILLTEKILELQEVIVAFGNDKSLGILLKTGWIESRMTFMHSIVIAPFNHPRFAKKIPSIVRIILSTVFKPFISMIYSKHATKNFEFLEMNEKSLKLFSDAYNSRKKNHSSGEVIRDGEYLNWRILNSPHKNSYKIFKTDYFAAIVSFRKNDSAGFIDLLCVSDTSDKNKIRDSICTIAMFGINDGYSHLRFFTSDKTLSEFISSTTKSRVKHPRFAYYAKDEKLKSEMKNIHWNIELIDSDFEHID